MNRNENDSEILPLGDAKLLTPGDVSSKLNVSLSTIYELCHRRLLPHVRIGVGRGAIRIRPQDLTAFVEFCRRLPKPDRELKHLKSPG